MVDLYEVLDISESGVAVQYPSPIEINQQVELSLDLAESNEQVSGTARVVWSDSAGRIGLGFLCLTEPALHRLRQWLFLNAIVGGVNATSSSIASSSTAELSSLRPQHTATLIADGEVQREGETLTDLDSVLSLIVLRSHSLLRASGAAIALAGSAAGTMTCRARAGQSAPAVGAILQVGSGFSGECIGSGKTLRCDDADVDDLVDHQSCRSLGIRSILAVPVRSGEKVIGLIEVFSAQSSAFTEKDGAILQFFAEQILCAVNRAASSDNSSATLPASVKPVFSGPDGVLFSSEAEEAAKRNAFGDADKISGIRLPSGRLYLAYCVTATIVLVLGLALAPWIQERLQARRPNGDHVVRASSRSLADPSNQDPSLKSGEIEKLRELTSHGNPDAENAMGLLYAQGDEKDSIVQDQNEAVRWFTKAAEHGSVPAQYKLSLLYWNGHGVPKDPSKAYFWAVLARTGGQEGSKDLAKVLARGMTRNQSAAIEQQAEIWHQQHESRAKPNRKSH